MPRLRDVGRALAAALLVGFVYLNHEMDGRIRVYWPRPNASYETLPRADGLKIVVTGGNVGLGLETARALVDAGARVLLTARTEEQGRAAAADVNGRAGSESIAAGGARGSAEAGVLDLNDHASVLAFARDAARRLGGEIDALVLNAGIMMSPLASTRDGLEQQVGVNHVGHAYLTKLLLPAVRAAAARRPDRGARVVAVSSKAAHTLFPLTERVDASEFFVNHTAYAREPGARNSPAWRAWHYGRSKLCNVLFAQELAKREAALANGVRAYSVHPGAVATELARNVVGTKSVRDAVNALFPLLSAREGALTQVFAAIHPDPAPSGAYLVPQARVGSLDHPASRDPRQAEELWRATDEILARWPAEV